MDVSRILDAVGAVVPVRAVNAFVTNTVNGLVTAIAVGRMAEVSSCLTELFGQRTDLAERACRLESVARMMAVSVQDMAVQTEVVVITAGAGDAIIFWNDCKNVSRPKRRGNYLMMIVLTSNAAIACPTGHILLSFHAHLRVGR